MLERDLSDVEPDASKSTPRLRETENASMGSSRSLPYSEEQINPDSCANTLRSPAMPLSSAAVTVEDKREAARLAALQFVRSFTWHIPFVMHLFVFALCLFSI